MAVFVTPRQRGNLPGFDSALPGSDARMPVVGWVGGKLVEGVRRGPMPTPNVSAASGPKILFGGKVNPASLSARTLDRIRANAAAQGVTQLLITSTQRDARGQAGAMYDNLVRYGERSQRQGYNANGNAVIDVAMRERKAGSSREATVAAMAEEIARIRATDATAFKHMMDPTRLQAVDILPRSLRGGESWEVLQNKLLSGFRSDRGVSRALGPDENDPVIHIEIPQD